MRLELLSQYWMRRLTCSTLYPYSVDARNLGQSTSAISARRSVGYLSASHGCPGRKVGDVRKRHITSVPPDSRKDHRTHHQNVKIVPYLTLALRGFIFR